MEKITTVGIDLAKAVFSLHGVDRTGRMVLQRTVRRDQLVKAETRFDYWTLGGPEAFSAPAKNTTKGLSWPKKRPSRDERMRQSPGEGNHK